MSALWRYVIGFYGALQSYQFGVAVAYAMSRRFNPQLAKEADIIADKKAIGVLINRDLPDFERRFLHSIVLQEEEEECNANGNASGNKNDNVNDNKNDANPPERENLKKYGSSCYEPFYDDHVHHLRAWRETTDHHRTQSRRPNESANKD